MYILSPWRHRRRGRVWFSIMNQTPLKPQPLYVDCCSIWAVVLPLPPAEKLRPEVIELNPKTAQIAREKGLPLHLGDASGTEILEKGGVHEACIVVVTVPDPRSAAQIIRTIHLLSPNLPVIARSRYQVAVPDLQRAGAVVIDEEHTVGIAIAREVIEVLRQPQNEAMACALAGQRPEEKNPGD